jgi:hypothetical protein
MDVRAATYGSEITSLQELQSLNHVISFVIIHFGATVNPLIKKNRMTLAVADGEVESFALVPVLEVAEMVHKSNSYKPSSAIVIIDFLFRHGYVFSPLS